MPRNATGMPAPPQAPKKRSFLKRLFGGKKTENKFSSVENPPPIREEDLPGLQHPHPTQNTPTADNTRADPTSTSNEAQQSVSSTQNPEPQEMHGFTVFSSDPVPEEKIETDSSIPDEPTPSTSSQDTAQGPQRDVENPQTNSFPQENGEPVSKELTSSEIPSDNTHDLDETGQDKPLIEQTNTKTEDYDQSEDKESNKRFIEAGSSNFVEEDMHSNNFDEISQAIDSIKNDEKTENVEDDLSKSIQPPKPNIIYDPYKDIVPEEQKEFEKKLSEQKKTKTASKSKPNLEKNKKPPSSDEQIKKIGKPPKPKEDTQASAHVSKQDDFDEELSIIPEPDFAPELPPLEDSDEIPAPPKFADELSNPEKIDGELDSEIESDMEKEDQAETTLEATPTINSLPDDEDQEKEISKAQLTDYESDTPKEKDKLDPYNDDVSEIPVIGIPDAPTPHEVDEAKKKIQEEDDELEAAHKDLLKAQEQFNQAHDELDTVHEELKEAHTDFEDAHKEFVANVHQEINSATERRDEKEAEEETLPELEPAPSPEDFKKTDEHKTTMPEDDADESEDDEEHRLLVDLMNLPPPVHPKEEKMPSNIRAVGKKTAKSSINYDKDIQEDFSEIEELKKEMQAQLQEKEKALNELENELSQKRQELDKKQSEIIEKEELIEKQKSEYQEKLKELESQEISDSKLALEGLEKEKEMHKKYAADLKRRETRIKNEEKRLSEEENKLQEIESRITQHEKTLIIKEKELANRDRIVTNKINKVNTSLEKINHEITEKEEILKVLSDEISRAKPALDRIKSLIKYEEEKRAMSTKDKTMDGLPKDATPEPIQDEEESVEDHLKALHKFEDLQIQPTLESPQEDKFSQPIDNNDGIESDESLEEDAFTEDTQPPVEELEIPLPEIDDRPKIPLEIEDERDIRVSKTDINSNDNQEQTATSKDGIKKEKTNIIKPIPDKVLQSPDIKSKPKEAASPLDNLNNMIENSKSLMTKKQFERAQQILEDAKQQLKNSGLQDKERKILKYSILEAETDINLAKLES